MQNNFIAWLRRKHDLIIYLILGVATTIVNFLIFYPLYNYSYVSATLSNIIAWCLSVLFAFFTNKPWAFKSTDWSLPVVIPELLRFVSCRIGSGVFETALIWITVDFLLWNGNVMKLIASVFVVVFNYFASKYVVFRK